ncbi:MAG: hypothetical protein Q8R92_13140 [Deltaproteobacteria bacterium]|nr:hypothetical protein [Deltaproteobacteria bacterium]
MLLSSLNFGAAVPLLLLALAAAPSAIAADQASEATRLEAEAETLWNRRDEPASMRSALDLQERIAAVVPRDARAQANLARAYWWYAHLLPAANVAERRELYRQGAGAARRAQALAPAEPSGYFWEAANLVEAITIGRRFVPPDDVFRIRKLVGEVNARNAWYQHGSIRYVEAVLILRLPAPERWMIGRRLSSAVDLAMGALGFENNCFYGHWVLAQALAATGRRRAAIVQLDSIIDGNPEGFLPDAPENRVVRKWAITYREELAAAR